MNAAEIISGPVYNSPLKTTPHLRAWGGEPVLQGFLKDGRNWSNGGGGGGSRSDIKSCRMYAVCEDSQVSVEPVRNGVEFSGEF